MRCKCVYILYILPIKSFLNVVFLQTGFDPSSPPVPSDPDPPSVDSMLSTHTVSPGEHVPTMSPETPPPTHLSSVPCASKSLHPDILQPGSELSSQTLEEPAGRGSSTQPPAPAPAPRQAQVDGEEGPPSEDSYIPTTDTHPPAALEQEETSESRPTGPACMPSPSVTFDLEVAKGASEPIVARPDDPVGRGDSSAAASPVAEDLARVGSEGETLVTPDVADHQTLSPFVSGLSQNPCDQAVSETEDAPQNPANSPTEASELDISRNLMSSAVFLGGIVSLSIVLQEPSSLFFMGLLLVLQHL